MGVDEIGEGAGITGPGIYRHFSSKDEILSTLFDEAVDALVGSLRADFADPREELQYLVAAHADFVVQHHELAAVMIRDERSLAEPHRRRHLRRERPYIQRWIACLQRCYPDATIGQATTATFAVLHLLNSVGAWPASARQTADLDSLLRRLALASLSALEGTRASVIAA